MAAVLSLLLGLLVLGRMPRMRQSGYLMMGGMIVLVSTGLLALIDATALEYVDPTDVVAMIGFAVLAARRPNVFGAVVGAIFVGVLLNGLTMLNVPYYTQDFVKGAVLVGALGLTYGLGRRPA